MKKTVIQKCLIKKYSAISFDIFDTLVERDTSTPSDVFRIVGAQVLGPSLAYNFREDRMAAEQMARERRTDSEVVLCEIYDELKEKYGEKTEELMNAEVEEELAVCHPRTSNTAWLRLCLDEGKKVFLVSDMYLPQKIIEMILSSSGIDGYERLYVSGTYRRNKRTGELFRTMLEENGLRAGEVMHIGDSFHADFLGAHKAGLSSVLVLRKRRRSWQKCLK